MSDPLFYLASLRDITCYVLRFVSEQRRRANASQSCQLYFCTTQRDHTELRGVLPSKSAVVIDCHVAGASVLFTETGVLEVHAR